MQRQQFTDDELMAAEAELEQEAIGLGQARYERLRLQGEDATPAGRAVIKALIEPLAEAVQEFCDRAVAGMPGPQAPLGQFLSQLPADDVAFITARAAINYSGGGGQDAELGTMAHSLGNQIERAIQSEALRKADPKAFGKLMTQLEQAPWEGRRRVLIKRAGEKVRLQTISWDKSMTPTRIGLLLFQLLEQSSGGLLYIDSVYLKGKTHNRLFLSEQAREQLEGAHRMSALHHPAYLPMVVPPRPWTSPYHGGYLDPKGLPLRLINAHRVNRNYLAELKFREMPAVYTAVNALQDTAWRINLRVAETLAAVWEGGLPLGKIPTKDLLPLPAAPWGDGQAPSEEARKAHVAKLARTYDANHKLQSQRRSIVTKLWVAEKFGKYEALYFPHTLDFRGRLYPVGSHVNPQADDSGRALLEFADGVALGDSGAYWLAVHGANAFGVDKVSYEERAAWVTAHTDMILACAADPLANTDWSDADKPWAFLAFCFEWGRLQDHVDSDLPVEAFVSHLPVSWDGSCNGLQNFSAMLRDPLGGAATNLVPADKPSDIYQQVADVANLTVERDAARGEVNAQYWVGKVTRKIAKRPTMTLPYGSGRYGFRQQLIEEMEKFKLENGRQYLDGGDPFLCAVYAANVLYDALGKVVVAARQAMDWLKEVSAAAARDGLPVTWSTPAGFLVMQDYRELIGKRVNSIVGTRRITVLLNITGDEIDKRQQAQGISPNFVHSLDASHLMLTVSKAHARGMRSFAMVHDSYGTHAGNAGALHTILREAFVEQYSGDVLGTFLQDIRERLPADLAAKIPAPPPVGTLDLRGVLDSDYFFA